MQFPTNDSHTTTQRTILANEVSSTLLHGNFVQYVRASISEEHYSRSTVSNLIKKMVSKPRRSTNVVHVGGDSFNLHILCGTLRSTIQVAVNATIDEISHQHNLPILGVWWSFNGKPMRNTIPIGQYGLYEGSTVTVNLRMCGGGVSTLLPLYTHVLDCEHQVLYPELSLQSEFSELDVGGELISKLRSSFATEGKEEWMIDLVESFVQTIYWTSKCTSRRDYVAAAALAYKLLIGKGLASSAWTLFVGSELQDDHFSNITKSAREWFQMGTDALKNPLVEKMRKLYTYMLVQGFLQKFGVKLSDEEYLKMDKKIVIKYSDKTNLIVTMIDTAITICERYDAYRVTGDWRAFIHDDTTYTKWSKTADRLVGLAPFTSNLEAHGTTYFAFVADLNDAIEIGEAVVKFSARNLGAEAIGARRKLNALQMLKNVEVTRRASQKERKAPFGVLIHGGSSVAKSTFTKMLYYYYGKIHGLDVDDHYRYVRNPADEYWSNFDSSKWCIQMDDIAFLLSSKASETDPTLLELLNVVNNVPYVPPQAALEDKGKTPVMAQLVLATSNAHDLNAQDYFHCPLAVRRRLPYVVHVVPKDEYLHENGKFISPGKLPKVEGAFPDFWKITVQRLVPEEHNGRDSAVLVDEQIFTNVNDFLKHFAEASLKHQEIQTKSESCDTHMRDIPVCRLCYNVGTCDCLQALEVAPWAYFLSQYVASYFGAFCFNILMLIIQSSVFILLNEYVVFRYLWMRVGRWFNSEREIRIHGVLNGQRNWRVRFSVKKLAQIGLVITQFYVMWKFASCIRTKVTKTERKTEEDVASEEDPVWEPQGNVFGSTEEQLRKEESQNVWYNPTMELSTFDLPAPSRSLANATSEGIRDLFSANCVRVEIEATDAVCHFRTGAVFLRGQFLCMNRHVLRAGTRFKMTIITGPISQGVTGNAVVYFNRSQLRESEQYDVVILEVTGVPPRKDILKYWNTHQIPVTQIVSVRRERNGLAEYVDYYNAQFCGNFRVEQLDTRMDVYMATSNVETKSGDCGSLAVAKTPRGPVILGLHTLGYKTTAVFPHLTLEVLEGMCGPQLQHAVVGGGEPQFSLNGELTSASLLPPHHKSVTRYLETGTVNVYGCMPGFRQRPKSSVMATPLQQEMLEELGCEINYSKPVMSGWEPVHNNVKEMVKPDTNIDEEVLAHCAEAYLKDIVDGLTQLHGEEWKKEVIFLSDRAAVNGLAKVKFIDRINTNTSMGHPWHKSKKSFIRPSPSEEQPDGIEFEEDVMERIHRVEQCFKEGKRSYPIFTGHLKDEPTSFAKIAKKKTRVFTGAPIDFSIASRKKLLPFVRLLQNNKFVFEAAPGTAAQSSEWTDIYLYLTKHGIDQIVAGDYGKFDKRMIATIIIHAFRIIAGVYRTAGFSEQECKEVMTIGYDIAFPVCMINGEILEFFGTNPSGHPFTVIINSLVNSLYMRYAYCQLNPDASKTCWSFKRSVALITYGDDNTMGVSRNAMWFNHTAIQAQMALIGVEYTMADKEAETRPFINISECSFLKRKWRWEPELKMYTCPLDLDSIHKSLTVWLPSKSIDKYAQMVAVIESANSEYFFHGRELFEKRRSFFQRVLAQEPYSHYVGESTLPDWDTLIERFRRASKDLNNFPELITVPGSSVI